MNHPNKILFVYSIKSWSSILLSTWKSLGIREGQIQDLKVQWNKPESVFVDMGGMNGTELIMKIYFWFILCTLWKGIITEVTTKEKWKKKLLVKYVKPQVLAQYSQGLPD